MKMTVLVDIDDTIIQLLPSWVGYLNKHYNLDVNYKDITDWDVSKFFPSLTKVQVYKALSQEEVWKNIKPMPGAVEYLKKLIDEDFDVYLVTATDYRNVFLKFEYVIKRYFPYITWDKVIVASNKSMIKGDFLIDDGWHNLMGGSYYPILFDAPHNHNAPQYSPDNRKYIRAYEWRQVYLWLNLIRSVKSDKEKLNKLL